MNSKVWIGLFSVIAIWGIFMAIYFRQPIGFALSIAAIVGIIYFVIKGSPKNQSRK